MKDKPIPSANPSAGYQSRKKEIDDAIHNTLNSGRYILGDNVQAFEFEFSKYVGASYGIGVASGTDAIRLAIMACGIGRGDHVVTVSQTAVATVSAIIQAEATPVLVDIDEETYTIDIDCLISTLRNRRDLNIKAIVPVHLYGNTASMNSIMRLAAENGLYVIEDCAQAHGATINEKRVGAIGDLGAFSFYPTKNMAALGDSGAIVTNNKNLYEAIMMLRQYGWRKRYISETPGINSRLDELQAAVLKVKLNYLEQDNMRRRSIADHYYEGLSNSHLSLPKQQESHRHVFHQFVVRTPQRDSLQTFLEEKNIYTSVLYPKPIHLQPGYASLITRGEGGLEVTEKICSELLCLPIYPELTDEDVDYICKMILDWDQKQ